MRHFLLMTITCFLSACSIVTVPIKVAKTAVGTAVDVVTTTVEVIVPDGEETKVVSTPTS